MKNYFNKAVSYVLGNSPWLGLILVLAVSEGIMNLPFVPMEVAVYVSAALFIGLGYLYLKKENKIAAYFIFGWISNTLILNYKFDQAGLEESVKEITKSWANTPAWSWMIFLLMVFLLVENPSKSKKQ